MTFLSLYFLDAFGRPVTGRKTKRGDGNTSDQGTGDEATLPRTDERQEKKKKKSGVQRSRSTQRSGQVSTPNVSSEVHKKQLFSGRRSGERREIGKLFIGTEEATRHAVGSLSLKASNLSLIAEW